MTSVRLRIDHIAVAIGREHQAAEAEETLRAALAMLAQRLADAPFDIGRDAPVRALELIELSPVTPDWLAGPGAAARLAEELYGRIWGAGR
jgi:hypothetical protein